MDKPMPKDTLRMDNILTDLDRARPRLWQSVVVVLISGAIVGFIGWFLFAADLTVMGWLFTGLGMGVLVVVGGWESYRSAHARRVVERRRFTIKPAKLVNIKEKTGDRYSLPSFWFYFAKYTRYEIPQESYPWAKHYESLSYRGLDNYSQLGDEFYVVAVGKRILAIYPTKLFEADSSVVLTPDYGDGNDYEETQWN